MSLTFCNQYTTGVSIAVIWYTPNCPDGGDWSKSGWYNLRPGDYSTVFHGDLDKINRYWCYYVEAADGACWAGDTVTKVTDRPFNWCINMGTIESRRVGFRLLDVGDHNDVTVSLVPSELVESAKT